MKVLDLEKFKTTLENLGFVENMNWVNQPWKLSCHIT